MLLLLVLVLVLLGMALLLVGVRGRGGVTDGACDPFVSARASSPSATRPLCVGGQGQGAARLRGQARAAGAERAAPSRTLPARSRGPSLATPDLP